MKAIPDTEKAAPPWEALGPYFACRAVEKGDVRGCSVLEALPNGASALRHCRQIFFEAGFLKSLFPGGNIDAAAAACRDLLGASGTPKEKISNMCNPERLKFAMAGDVDNFCAGAWPHCREHVAYLKGSPEACSVVPLEEESNGGNRNVCEVKAEIVAELKSGSAVPVVDSPFAALSRSGAAACGRLGDAAAAALNSFADRAVEVVRAEDEQRRLKETIRIEAERRAALEAAMEEERKARLAEEQALILQKRQEEAERVAKLKEEQELQKERRRLEEQQKFIEDSREDARRRQERGVPYEDGPSATPEGQGE